MNDYELQQRIKYLIEHGGLYDDPLQDIRRKANFGVLVGVAAVVFHNVEFLIRFV